MLQKYDQEVIDKYATMIDTTSSHQLEEVKRTPGHCC